MPYVLAFALTMIVASFTLPRTAGEPALLFPRASVDCVGLCMSDLSIASFLFFWLALAAFSGSYIWGNVGLPPLPRLLNLY